MDIFEKLKYYSDSNNPKKEESKKSNLTELAQILNGIIFQDNSLPLIKRETSFPLNQLQIESGYNESIKLPVLTKGDFSKPINTKDLLFFDLETTGLAGGAGTYPFLIGIAYFEVNEFKVVQYFLPEYERDIYAYFDIKKIVSQKSILPSFNGKSYDYPLLRNRFILNRFDDMFRDCDHLDLLHLSRRMWKNSLDNCSLGNIEQKIFKFSRLNDIEGYLIPHAYFDYLQTGNFDDIVNIILHNEQDLVSLGRLIFHLSQIENEVNILKLDDLEIISLFNSAINSSSLLYSYDYFEIIKKRKVNIPHKSIFNFSLLLKKYSKWKEAYILWESLIESESYALLAYEELAKYHEHRIKDINKAREFTVKAINLLELQNELYHHHFLDYTLKNFQYRLRRLNSKLKLS